MPNLCEVLNAVRVGQQVALRLAIAAVAHHHKARGGGGVLPLALPGAAGAERAAMKGRC